MKFKNLSDVTFTTKQESEFCGEFCEFLQKMFFAHKPNKTQNLLI